MTIQYGTNFFYALFRWRGSVWKSVWKELLLWLVFYYSLRFILIYAIPIGYKNSVTTFIQLFDSYTQRLPLEFLLGFYVSQVVSRWWSQTVALTMPNDLMATITAYIPNLDTESRFIRCVIARHIVLAFVLAYRRVSSRLRRMFPNNDKFLDLGLVTQEENDVLTRAYDDTVYELPFQWVQENFRKKAQGGINVAVLASMNAHRAHFSALAKFNVYNVPLVYTQTVTVAVYGYFIFCIIGHQFYYSDTDTIFPFLTILRFLFGVGWLKVAEDLAKPFGDDDDDTNLCSVLQAYIRMIYTVADYAPSNKPRGTVLSDDVPNADGCCCEELKPFSVEDCRFRVDSFLALFDPTENVPKLNKKKPNKLDDETGNLFRL